MASFTLSPTDPPPSPALAPETVTVTFSPFFVAGGATVLSGLTDVSVTEGPAIDGHALAWDDALSKWTALGLAAVAKTGAYADLTGKPTLFDGTWASLTGKPSFAAVATSGAYGDLSGRPTLGTLAALSYPGGTTDFLRSDGTWAAPAGGGGSALPAFRNRLRNAAFAVNQRNVSGTVTLSAGQYGHDGVKAGASGATYTFAASGIDTTITITAGSLILPIEDKLIEGGVYTLSHDGTAQARVWQGTGSTGSGAYAAAPLTTASLTAATQTNVEFSTGTILRPQFEPGTAATAFERRPPSFELAACQRFYYRLVAPVDYTVLGMMSAYDASGVWGKLFEAPVELRAAGGTIGFSAVSDIWVYNAVGGAPKAASSIGGPQASTRIVAILGGMSVSGSPGFTAGQALFCVLRYAGAWIDVSVEI